MPISLTIFSVSIYLVNDSLICVKFTKKNIYDYDDEYDYLKGLSIRGPKIRAKISGLNFRAMDLELFAGP